MKYLVDSDWVVDYLVGRQAAVVLLSTIAEEGFRKFLRGVTILPLNRSIMQRFGHIRGDLRRRGLLIGDPDILIAATAMYHDLTLLTRNKKDYERIPTIKAHFSAVL